MRSAGLCAALAFWSWWWPVRRVSAAHRGRYVQLNITPLAANPAESPTMSRPRRLPRPATYQPAAGPACPRSGARGISAASPDQAGRRSRGYPRRAPSSPSSARSPPTAHPARRAGLGPAGTRRRSPGSPPIPVGTALAGGPPDRSRRAELPHRAPASGPGVEAHAGLGMHDADRRQPPVDEATHPLPGQAVPLAPAAKCTQPAATRLALEGPNSVDVAWHGVVGEMTPHHACQPAPLLGDG